MKRKQLVLLEVHYDSSRDSPPASWRWAELAGVIATNEINVRGSGAPVDEHAQASINIASVADATFTVK